VVAEVVEEPVGPPGRRFAIRYAVPMLPLLTLLGAGPRRSGVWVTAEGVEVRMGWAFRGAIPRRTVSGAAADPRRHLSLGVHGWAGRWLVNGGLRGLVRIAVAPPARARVLGVPVRLRELTVGVEDPAGLIAALR